MVSGTPRAGIDVNLVCQVTPELLHCLLRVVSEIVIGRLHHVVIDCPDPSALASFYTELLGLPVTYDSGDWVVIAADDWTSGIAFQLAPNHKPPKWPDPDRPQQFHLDIMVDDVADARSRVLDFGARRLAGDVFADPAATLFASYPDHPGQLP